MPFYVLEYLLGQYAASDDEATIQAGIDTVRKILADHYVHRNQSELVKSTIRERGRHRIIDKVTVTLNEKEDLYHAEFANLGIKSVIVEPATIKAHPKLLVGGVWCICDIEYLHSEDARFVPWILGSIKPIQLSNFDFEGYLAARRDFTTDEWIDLLVQSIGFNPELFGRRAKLIQLVRLIPFVERNYNLAELGPKGTGKSHIFSEFSPHGMLISGGEVTVPKLFVSNSNGRLGLVGYWDVVAFGAEASMVFVGNTSRTVPYMLKNSDLFDELLRATTTRHSSTDYTTTSLAGRSTPFAVRCSPTGTDSSLTTSPKFSSRCGHMTSPTDIRSTSHCPRTSRLVTATESTRRSPDS